MLKKCIIICGLILNAFFCIFAQNIEVPLNNEVSSKYEAILENQPEFHTSIKPYIVSYKIFDSINNSLSIIGTDNLASQRKNSVNRNFSYQVSPEVFSGFSDNISNAGSYTLGGGFLANAFISNNWSFQLAATVNYSEFPKYINEKIDSVGVIPHYGKYLQKNGNTYLYSYLSARILWHPVSFMNLNIGYGQNFLGDGYRSLFLSDNSSPYPYFQVEFQAWRLKYISMLAYIPDINSNSGNTELHSKFGVFHYLSFNISKWLNMDFFESIIWQGQDTLGTRGIEVNYLNPFLFLRPVEFSLGSPDNELMGIGIKLTPAKNFAIYGQSIIDEFNLSEIIAQRGWWGNKYGFQIGMKSYNLFDIQNFMLQLEYNVVRPYTYSHETSLKCYGYEYQPLAHPLGANFAEAIISTRYSVKRITILLKSLGSVYGADTGSLDFGKNIYKSYFLRYQDYHNYIGQGLKTVQLITDAKISYLIKPQWNLNFYIGARLDSRETVLSSQRDLYLYFGFETLLFNSDVDY